MRHVPDGGGDVASGDSAHVLPPRWEEKSMVGNRERVPFPMFVGRGRSGTTLLRAIFDAHPALAIPDESHFLSALGTKRHRYERGHSFDVDRFCEDLSTRPPLVRWGISGSALREELYSVPPRDYPDAARRVFAHYARMRGKSRYGDKTPNYVLSIDLLAELFPETRFVHVIRDGRDVALSYLDVPWGPSTLEEAAFLWRRAVQRGRVSGRALGPGRYRELRYEELVENPERAVRDLCEFVDLRFDPAMLAYHQEAGRIVSRMPNPETRQSLFLPPTKGLRDWRTQLTARDVALFDVWAGDLLEELGYERATARTSPAIHLQARRRALGVQVRRVASASSGRVPARLKSTLERVRGVSRAPRR